MAARAEPLRGRQVWTGAELGADRSWVRAWPAGALEDIHAAFLALPSPLGANVAHLTVADFPLPRLRPFFGEVQAELEDGRGVVRLQGFPVERYTEEECRAIFWCLSRHLGTPAASPPRPGFMGEVKDLADTDTLVAQQLAEAQRDGDAGVVLASAARAQSTGPLRFHTDPFDLILLMALSVGADGGLSKLASQPHVYNQVLRRRPDLHPLLCQDVARMRPGDETTVPDEVFHLPPMMVRQGKTANTQYSRTYVEQAQERAAEFGVRLHTSEHDEALDLLAEIAEESCVTMPFATGDLQIVNNHNCFHGRTAYSDDRSAAGGRRKLLRLWLQVDQPRLLPEGAAELRARGVRADADELLGQGLLQGQAGEGTARL